MSNLDVNSRFMRVYGLIDQFLAQVQLAEMDCGNPSSAGKCNPPRIEVQLRSLAPSQA